LTYSGLIGTYKVIDIYTKKLKEGKMARYTGPRIRIIRRLGLPGLTRKLLKIVQKLLDNTES
jgi:hypothetical protein